MSLRGEESRGKEERIAGKKNTQEHAAFGKYYDEYAYITGPQDEGREINFDKRNMHELYLTARVIVAVPGNGCKRARNRTTSP